ncbi:MAG: DUF308 domain-containing protein [Butyrivibrio sp.]|nr:DUF308 domain-containing protein [Butyrivibrio sp.]
MGALKKISLDYVIKAVVMVVIGVILAVWTKASLNIVARALAALLFAIGAVFVLTYLFKKERTFVISGGLVAGILIAAVGGWIFVNPGKFTDFIPKLFGIFIMVSGLGNLWQTISLVRFKSRAWWVSLLIAVVTAGLGAFLFFNPTNAKEIAVTLIGAFLIIDGATNLLSALMVGIAANRVDKEKDAIEKANAAGAEIVEAEVVDGKVVEVEEEK